MGLIFGLLNILFGDNRNVMRETVGVFRENAEFGAERSAAVRKQAMTQFASEFAQPKPSSFDRFALWTVSIAFRALRWRSVLLDCSSRQ